MSEIIVVEKKKKKKEYDYKKAVKKLKPLIVKWSNASMEFANEIHKEYLNCPNFEKLCQKLGCSPNTIYSLFDRYALPRKYEKMSDAAQERFTQKLSELEKSDLSPAEVDDAEEGEIDSLKYKETYHILNEASRLSVNMFQVQEREELIEKLQNTIAKLNGLLVRLESGLEE